MQIHQPVLVEEVVKLLAPQPDESYLDLTAGYGGHTAAIANKLGQNGRLTLVDRDRLAIDRLTERFKIASIRHQDYASAAAQLAADGQRFDMILLDLGISSPQLENASRGFSFNHRGPLDMRMDSRQELTAAQLVNHADEATLADIIYRYGQEHRSRQIAHAIVGRRPLYDTSQLANVVSQVVRAQGKIHPATRTFMALRIAVNDELGQLEQTLERLTTLLSLGGRVAIISFHSLEDRLVKHWLKESRSQLTTLTTKPLSGKQYDVSNPRARSAQLRAAVKTKK